MDSAVTVRKIRSVVGALDQGEGVDRLLSRLEEIGVAPEEVSVMTRDAAPAASPAVENRSSRISGAAATGAALGGLIGALAGWMISIGALPLPGVVVPGTQLPGYGPIFGAGTLASLLTGLLFGAAAGGLIGALLALRVPDEEAERYAEYAHAERTLVTVHLSGSAEEDPVVAAFEEAGAYDVRVYETPAEAAVQGVPRRQAHHETTPASQQVYAPEEESFTESHAQETEVGDASAHTDALGSRAEGGLGSGEALGGEPLPDSAAAAAGEPEAPQSQTDAAQQSADPTGDGTPIREE